MNGAVKRTKQLRRFIGKLLMIFFFFLHSSSLSYFSFSFLNHLREIFQNLLKEIVYGHETLC